ncbi:MAG: DUF4178 domain-containing protein, partial [Planktomarina sp.]
MTRSAQVKAINCTSCGAGLNIHGGGRVVVHVCSYCGSELNAQDDYKIIKKFAHLKRPDSPFEIGMQGQINGVEFTVIGTIQFREIGAKRVWEWVDHQLYSPTHGYATLTVENGHVTFTRRDHLAGSVWMSSQWVETAEHPPIVGAHGKGFKYFETSAAHIVFVEGEFNWAPQIGGRSTTVTAMSDDIMLSFEDDGSGEREVYQTTYVSADEVYTAFGVSNPPRQIGTHAVQPYVPHRSAGFFKKATLAFTAAALVLIMILMFGFTGRTVLNQQLAVSDLPAELTFDVTHPGRLAKIRVQGNANNSWAYIAVGVTDPDDVPVFEAGRTVEYYTGRDADGRWTEGRRSSTLRFIPKQAGTYSVEVALEENQTWNGSGTRVTQVSIDVRQGRISPMWMIGSLFCFIIMLAILFGIPYNHHRKNPRWYVIQTAHLTHPQAKAQ